MNNRKQKSAAATAHQEAKKKVREGFMGQRMIVLPPNITNSIARIPLIQRLYLTAIGFYPHATYHDRERKTGSPQYILLYCLEGSGHIYLAGKQHQLLPNSFFIIPKAVPHHYRSSNTEPWSIFWAHFTGDHADILYKRYTAGLEPEVKQVPFDASRISLFNQIMTTLENSFGEPEIEISNLNFLHFLSTFIYQGSLSPAADTSDAISKSISFMKANLSRRFTIQELASEEHLSVSHFSELFRQKTGFAPIQYFNQLKVQQSCQYLYFTDRSIKEICTALGFEDPYYFSRLFRKMMGLPPSNYKNLHKRQ